MRSRLNKRRRNAVREVDGLDGGVYSYEEFAQRTHQPDAADLLGVENDVGVVELNVVVEQEEEVVGGDKEEVAEGDEEVDMDRQVLDGVQISSPSSSEEGAPREMGNIILSLEDVTCVYVSNDASEAHFGVKDPRGSYHTTDIAHGFVGFRFLQFRDREVLVSWCSYCMCGKTKEPCYMFQGKQFPDVEYDNFFGADFPESCCIAKAVKNMLGPTYSCMRRCFEMELSEINGRNNQSLMDDQLGHGSSGSREGSLHNSDGIPNW